MLIYECIPGLKTGEFIVPKLTQNIRIREIYIEGLGEERASVHFIHDGVIYEKVVHPGKFQFEKNGGLVLSRLSEDSYPQTRIAVDSSKNIRVFVNCDIIGTP